MKGKYYTFGATSAVITGLAVIVGFSGTANAKISMLSALLLIAIADNISDSFGIHVHQESQSEPVGEVRRATFTNFVVRLLVVGVFVLMVLFLPNMLSLILSMVFGLIVIAMLSYQIAKEQKANPYKVIVQHMFLTIFVMAASFVLKELVSGLIKGFL